jgi:hypothetical protein
LEATAVHLTIGERDSARDDLARLEELLDDQGMR